MRIFLFKVAFALLVIASSSSWTSSYSGVAEAMPIPLNKTKEATNFNQQLCTYDYTIIQRVGKTTYDGLPIKIMRQAGDIDGTVDFVIGNTWKTNIQKNDQIDAVFVVLNSVDQDDGSKSCYADTKIDARKSIGSSLQAYCSRAGVAIVRLYATDTVHFGVGSNGIDDTAKVPQECWNQVEDNSVDKDAPGVEYVVVLQCNPTCNKDSPIPDPDPFEIDLDDEISSHPSSQPNSQPSPSPNSQPSSSPNSQPSSSPNFQPSSSPNSLPSFQPNSQPSLQPNSQPSASPNSQPSSSPNSLPSSQPNSQPSFQPNSQPSSQPNSQPSFQPNSQPSSQPNSQPSSQPNSQPNSQPSSQPSTNDNNADVISLKCPEYNGETNPSPKVIDGNNWKDGDIAEIEVMWTGQDTLCMLAEMTVIESTNNGATSYTYSDLKPIGRSYNKNEWEVAPGDFATAKFDCISSNEASTKCRIALPTPPQGRSYVLRSVFGYGYDHKDQQLSTNDKAARFLERATFGPTKASVASFTNPEDWITEQFAMERTSHRRFFRERATDWFSYTSRIGLLHTSMGPCTTGTRYRNFALLRNDFEGYLEVRKSPLDANKLILTVYETIDALEGQIRTVVDAPMQYGTYNRKGEIVNGELTTIPLTQQGTRFFITGFRPTDGVGGRFTLSIPTGAQKSITQDIFFNGVSGNPRVQFDEAHKSALFEQGVVELGNSNYEDVMTQYFFEEGSTEVLQLTSNVSGSYCKELENDVTGLGFPAKAVLASTTKNGSTRYWLHTPTFNLLNNDLDAPLLDGGKQAVDLTKNPPLNIPEEIREKLKATCSNVHRTFLNEDSCRLAEQDACSYDADADINASSTGGVGKVLVCGSPGEGANNHDLDSGTREKGGFNLKTGMKDAESGASYDEQKNSVWAEIALHSKDQLAQRMAYALNQILVVGDGTGAKDASENLLGYYDIFVRNAFGNYFDILKEVTRHPLMSKMLTYINGQSTAYAYIRNGILQQADENYAREVMQLFSIGVALLNDDGTLKLDGDGNEIGTYTNFDISEYAKVYAGFVAQDKRGNIETNFNEVDPLRIETRWKDQFPKLGLNSTYIGDGYTLCSDLPVQHFLKKGATYRILGAKSNADFAPDGDWISGKSAVRLSLNFALSTLASTICNRNSDGQCDPRNMVVLPDDVECEGMECKILEARTIEVAPGLWYEYIRPPCVNKAFYDDGKNIFRIYGKDQGQVLCGNPSTLDASTVCCNPSNGKNRIESRNEFFSGERVSFQNAEQRCSKEDLQLCDFYPQRVNHDCNSEDNAYACDGKGVFYWLSTPCSMSAKVSPEGNVAIVHDPSAATSDRTTLADVSTDTKSFFRADWRASPAFSSLGGFLENFVTNCESIQDCFIDDADGNCQCKVAVEETMAFGNVVDLISIDNVLSAATIGAFVPEGTSFVPTGFTGINQFPSGALAMNTIFEVTDNIGRTHYRKNLLSIAELGDGSIRFRNPVTFWSLQDVTVRDGEYELDAALKHYFYHPNVPSFLARTLAQRFGRSNPSPRYIKEIATAFKTGTYGNFGSKQYGCLEATVAAIILDRESVDYILDADPIHGQLHGPYLRIIKAMRASEYKTTAKNPLVRFKRDLIDTIGEEPHHFQTVFSFFGPAYVAPGRARAANMFAPEAQVLNGPTSVSTANGMLSLFKYGSARCGDSFFGTSYQTKTSLLNVCVIGDDDYNFGSNAYDPAAYGLENADEIVNDLAMLLTSGRLSPENREIVRNAYSETLINGQTEDRKREALINAQQLIALSPEFNTNSLVHRTNKKRTPPEQKDPTGVPYKAVIQFMLDGGLDSFNVLVPKSCSGTNEKGTTVDVQYLQERGALAFSQNEFDLTITPGGTDQPCEEFAIHEDLPFIKELYDDKDLLFFANTGVVNKPNMNRDNWDAVTRSRLFAHNSMTKEVKKNDPFDVQVGSGVLGRMADLVYEKFNSVVNTIGIQDNSIALAGNPTIEVPLSIVGRDGPLVFPKVTKEEQWFDIESKTAELNAEHDGFSGIFGDTWSDVLMNGINDGERLSGYFEKVDVNEDIWKPVADEASIARSFKTLAKMIKTRADRKVDRDAFTLEYGGFDHHQDMKALLKLKLIEVNRNIERLVKQLKEDGLWDQVTIVVSSEFGRTISPNSNNGADHGWGGNYFILGGGIRGGRILGKYPSDLTTESPLNASRNTRTRFMPTMAWDTIWNGIAEWFSDGFGKELTEEDLDYVLPNRKNCINPVQGQGDVPLFSKNDLYD